MYKLFSDISELVTLSGAAKKGARKVTEKDLSIIKNAEFITQRGKIVWVGNQKKLTLSVLKQLNINVKELKKMSLSQKTVMPSFIECHTHSVFAGHRQDEFEQRNAGASYQDIAKAGGGILSTVKNTRKASESELLTLAQKRIYFFLKQGVTTTEIKSGYGLDLKTELKILSVVRKLKKMRVVSTYLGPHAIPKEFKSASKYVDYIIEKVLPLLVRKKLLDRADIFIEKGYFDPLIAEKYFAALRSYDVGITAHIDQLTCSGGVKKICNDESVQSLDHLVEISKGDIKALSQSKCTGVLLPSADFYLQMKYPPARKLIDAGVRVALATDFNPGSAPSQDLSLVGVLARLEMKMSLPEVICAYTLGASHALGLSNSLGSIEVGKFADFVCLEDNIDQLFYSVGQHPISSVWSKGAKLFSN